MTRKKGGGRGSGQRGTGPDPQSFGDEAPSHEQPSGGIVAAANPAAFSVGEHDCPKECHERIRELEAELAHRGKWNDKYEKDIDACADALQLMKARAERAEAEVAGLRTSHAISEARNQREHARAERAEALAEGWHGVAYENLARAERAEALVQRARELIPDWPPEELRGEDRG